MVSRLLAGFTVTVWVSTNRQAGAFGTLTAIATSTVSPRSLSRRTLRQVR
jgi:hypothetical protein